MATSAAIATRHSARSGELSTHTSSLAPGHVQANLLVLPSKHAADFAKLCARNPVSCPLIGRSQYPGSYSKFDDPSLFSSNDIDVRTDSPMYNVYKSGHLIDTKTDICDEWSDQSIAFLIGCSYSFEQALADAGLPPRNWEQSTGVAMYNTKVKLNPAGIFTGACQIVSMRPYLPEDVEKVRNITRPYLKTHGEPVAWGWDAVEDLSIRDINDPDYGNHIIFREGEVPVFWGCGVTPQASVMAAGDKIAGKVMAHKPGHMIILDMTEDEMFRENFSQFDYKLSKS